jgi:acyl-CoA reductase-like NAD-dependent aldehyde dehydrogenase
MSGAAVSYEWKSLYIGGNWVPPSSDEVVKPVNPATEEVLGIVPQGHAADAEKAIAAARSAFDEGQWPRLAVRERTDVLRRMSAVMRRRRQEFFDVDLAETGRAAGSVPVFVDVPFDRWDDLIDRVVPAFEFVEPMPPFITGGKVGQGAVHREPFGVVSVITPFNAPLMLALAKLGPALAAGCTVVLKPSPYTPISAFLLAEVADEAGLPPGVLNVLPGNLDVGQQLTTHRDVDMVSFTGSDTVGRQILAQASGTLKKVVLELGGKSGNIICEDADLAKVAPHVLQNFTGNAGQGCGMLTRTIVHESVHDALVDRLLGLLPSVRVGNPADNGVTMGPLISSAQLERVEELIAAGLDEGARIAYGGKRPGHLSKGFYLEPTLMVDVRSSMQVAQREFFGPVGVVIPFRSDEEAVRIANDSDYGLAGSVWSADAARAYQIAQRIRTGSVAVNGGGGRLNPHGPFGGYKASGLGREWGRWGLEEFLQHKTISWPVAGG